MKFLYIALLLMLAPVVTSLAGVPKPVTDLGGSDDIEKLIEGYPEEKYDVSSTLCGLKPTPEFRDGFSMALRLCRLGADPHYLVYDGLEELPKSYPSLRTFGLQNYKHTARLLEAIRGFNYSMAMRAWELKARKQIQEGEQGGTGQPATRPESKPEGGAKPQPESEGRSR